MTIVVTGHLAQSGQTGRPRVSLPVADRQLDSCQGNLSVAWLTQSIGVLGSNLPEYDIYSLVHTYIQYDANC